MRLFDSLIMYICVK